MARVSDLLATATAQLGGEDARREAEILLAHVLGKTRTALFARPEFVPTPQQCAQFGELVQSRRDGRPIAYLVGQRAFWSLDLAVSPAVLIPRAETEVLVEQALVRIPPHAAYAIADLGTGSGAIALALARERPQARVLATDASADALEVARGNASRLGIANVAFAQGDWCAALGDARFDLIVSNPPYLADGDAHLQQGDLRHEPRAALASGADGLDAIRCIVHGAPAHLRSGAWLLLEHGWQQGPAVRELLRDAGFSEVVSVPDLEQRERVSGGRVA